MEDIDSLKSYVHIQPSWEIDSGCSDLKETVKFSAQKSCSLEDLVQIESCVHMSSSKGQDVPYCIVVKLDKSSNRLITGFSVVSEARIIECFGELGEYYCTVHADYMDDFEGCAVYSATSDLPLTSEVTLKFAKMKHEQQMWMYGLMFRVEHVTAPQMEVAGINLLNVNQILRDSSTPLSEKAESCKRFLQQCSTSSAAKVPDPQILMKMFEAGYLKSFGETSRSLSNCISNYFPFLANKDSERPDDSCARENGHSTEVTRVSHQNDSSSREYIDERFTELEKKLTDRIDRKFKELEITQNQKLDTIIKLLERK